MQIGSWALVACLLVGCSGGSKPPPQGRIVVAITADWEGAYLSPEGLDAIDKLRTSLGKDVPITHFVCPAYFSKPEPDPTAVTTLTQAVRAGDELAMHLHAWKSLAVASSIEPKLAPSYLTGTDKILEFEDDVGFDTDLDAYTGPELRALLRTSRKLLETTKLPVSKAFRAGGYLATPKVLQAIRDEGYTIDSSAIDYHQLDEHEQKNEVLPKRVAAIWPDVDARSQPWLVPVRGGDLVELPIAAFVDYASAAEITAILEAAEQRRAAAPTRDQFVVLGFHQETAEDLAPRLTEAVGAVRARPEVAKHLLFTTVEHAASLARAVAAPRPTSKPGG